MGWGEGDLSAGTGPARTQQVSPCRVVNGNKQWTSQPRTRQPGEGRSLALCPPALERPLGVRTSLL